MRKHRRKHRKRDDSYQDDHEQYRKEKKHRKREDSDEERKRRKHRKKHRRSNDDYDDEDSRSPRKKDKKRKKEKSDRTKVDKKSLIPLGDPLGKPPSTMLDPEKDYFAYHEHLYVYLYRERGLAFNDLTSEETRKYFRNFVKQYNSGELAEGYYVEKLPPTVLEECKTTKHSWSFRISESEGRTLQSIESGVQNQTEYKDPARQEEVQTRISTEEDKKPMSRSREDFARDRATNRRLKEHIRAAEEEFSGGPKEGRERQIEKRREIGARMHGASRDKEAALAAPEVSDDVLYGGDDRRQFERARERSAQRQESHQKRLAELESKEKERQEAMFKQLGLKNLTPGQKITIQPRKDD